MNRNDEVRDGPQGRGDGFELNGAFLGRPAGAGPGAWDDPLRATPGAVRLQAQEGGAADEATRLELVLDGTNLLPFHFLRTGDRLGRAVVKIQRDDGSTGTGFLVAPDILLTNHHVLPDGPTAAASVALANYEVSPPNDPAGRSAAATLDPAALFVTNADLDFTFCGVTGLDFLGAIPLDRERMHVAVDETVTIIQHPRGRPKEVALRENRVVRADGVVLQYACDTEPGSSGSPVFNDQWKPVAIHHASVLTDSPEGRRVGTRSRARYLNEGIRLSAIALWLETAEANDPAHRDRVARLRALFGGLNPRAGFFGALGRRSHGRPAAAVVAESYGDRPGALDVGFWDTRTLASAPGGLLARAAEIGRVIADMGLDVWCLARGDAAALDAICERLWAVHGLSYQPVPLAPASPGGGAPGVLARPSKAIAAEPLEGGGPLPPRARVRVGTGVGSEVEILLVPAASGPRLLDLFRAILVGPRARRGRLAGDGRGRRPDPRRPLHPGRRRRPALRCGRRDRRRRRARPGRDGPAAWSSSRPTSARSASTPRSRLIPAHDRGFPPSLDLLHPAPARSRVRISLDRARPRPPSRTRPAPAPRQAPRPWPAASTASTCSSAEHASSPRPPRPGRLQAPRRGPGRRRRLNPDPGRAGHPLRHRASDRLSWRGPSRTNPTPDKES